MTKHDLVMRVAEQTGNDPELLADLLRRFLDGIVEALVRGETVEFRNFGVFKVQTRKPRVGRNPKKPENTVIIPERRTVKFKPGRIMRERIIYPRS